MKFQKGLIHKIEKFSLHDGPGIRTLIVMKGCPLKCLWCSSPYTQNPNPEILYISSNCRACGQCVEVCPQQAISMEADSLPVRTDRTLCGGCGKCVEVCTHQARELSGRQYMTEDLLKEVEKDSAFYRRSGGGITVGGGEPTLQAPFVGEFLSLCRSHYFHTAMETCALTSWEKLEPLLESLDIVYIDLKHMDETRHLEWTGASNRVIHENIRRVAKHHPVILRIPVVPGFNDSPANITESANFAKQLGRNILRLELLPYHQFGRHGYDELERDYPIPMMQPPSGAHLEKLREWIRAAGIQAEIGG